MEDDLQSKNNLVGDQLGVIIEEIHGECRPFILILPPLEDQTEAQLVTNVDNIEIIRNTIWKLDASLSKIKELKTAESITQ